jgi:hypothetical protein
LNNSKPSAKNIGTGKPVGFKPTREMREWMDAQVRRTGCSLSYICKTAVLASMEQSTRASGQGV